MTITTEQITKVLGESKTRTKVLTEDMKEEINLMVADGMSLDDITIQLQESNDRVKKYHVKNYLVRQLKKLSQ